MENTKNDIQVQSDYYRSQFIESNRSTLTGDNSMVFIVKEGTDLIEYAQAAKAVWESVGDYPLSFTGVVKYVDGNSFATFQYEGALSFTGIENH